MDEGKEHRYRATINRFIDKVPAMAISNTISNSGIPPSPSSTFQSVDTGAYESL
ncbi:hypothetical protein AWENTII_003721 [Aspergillus wentii]